VDESYSPKGCPEDVELLQALGLEPGYILYLGGFDSRKNLRAVFGAFAKVRREMAGAARLVVAGRLPTHDSAFAPDPRRLMQEGRNEPDAVHFTGFVPESTKPALYRGARAFLLPLTLRGIRSAPLGSAGRRRAGCGERHFQHP
jgi:glycosyltransferase involved in cell wall biosynthesis